MNEDIFSPKDMIELQNILRFNSKKITCAESCTGGLIASMITSQSGSSDIFDGSIVSYSNEIKKKELNVTQNSLENFGAVSVEVVNEMLIGSLKKFNCDFAIAISGIAGPNGGSKEKPVGTVIIGIGGKNTPSNVDVHVFSGTREEVQIRSAKTALKKLLKFVQKTLDK